MPEILTLTLNPAIDKSSSVEHVVPEHKLRCAPPRFDPGGGGINVARVLHRLGGETRALFPSGGRSGQMLQELLEAEGIPISTSPVAAMTRENFTVYDESSGQQYRFGMPGAALQAHELDACLESLRQFQPDYLVISGSLPPDTSANAYRRAIRIGREIGAKVVLDTSGKALSEALDGEGVYLLKPNMRELGALAGQPIRDAAQQRQAARALIDQGKAEVVVVSLGGAGALLVTEEQARQYRTPTVPIRSTVGAGDSMVGGIVLGLAQGKSLPDAVLYGIAAGSATVMSDGTQLCDPQDVARLYAELQAEKA